MFKFAKRADLRLTVLTIILTVIAMEARGNFRYIYGFDGTIGVL